MMPRTNPKRESTTRSGPQSASANGSASEVLTLAEAAVYLRLAETDVLRLVQEQGLPARRLAREWRFLKVAIQEWLSTSSPKGSKEALLALAGAWKDDPDLEDMVEEIYRRRGRPITEDGSYRLSHGLDRVNSPK